MVSETCVKQVPQTDLRDGHRAVRSGCVPADDLRDADGPVRPEGALHRLPPGPGDDHRSACPVTVKRQVTECKTVCVPRTICRQVPVEVCVKVPVTVHCPAARAPLGAERRGLARSRRCRCTTLPACDPCDKQAPALRPPPPPLSDVGESELLSNHERPPPTSGTPPGAVLRGGVRDFSDTAPSSRSSKAPLGDQPIERGPEPGEGPGAMAELVLDQDAQLAERLVVFGDQEQGIIAEPVAASRARVIRPRQAPSASRRIVPTGSARAR